MSETESPARAGELHVTGGTSFRSADPEPSPTIRIRPMSGWFSLDLKELWQYRELIAFLASQGIIGALGQTGASSTVATLRAVRGVFDEMVSAPPDRAEVSDAIDRTRNGWVFNFQDPGQIVSRLMALHEQGLPLDWLTRYLDGVRSVTPEAVHDAIRTSVDPETWVVLVVGNPEEFDAPLETLGPVTEWTPAGN